MYCGKCGNQNSDSAKFCGKCGAPLNGVHVQAAQNGGYAENTDYQSYGYAGNAGSYAQDGRYNQPGRGYDYINSQNNQNGGYQQRPMPRGGGGSSKSLIEKFGKKKLIAALAAIAAVIIIVVVIIAAAASHKTRIDVSDYVVVELSGAEGYGSIDVSGLYNWEDEAYAIIYDKYDETSEKFYTALYSMYDIEVTCDIDQAENLSNGDTVTITITVDDEDAEGLPFKLTASKITYEVEGLSEVQAIDLFSSIEVTYSGLSPYAEVYIDGGFDSANINYYASNSEDLANGDTITIYAEYDEDELIAAGYIAESDYTTITVSGLDEYVTSLDDIPESSLEEMKSQAEDAFYAHVANHWSDDEIVNDMEFLGCYLIYAKSGGYFHSTANRVYLVYKVSAENGVDGDFTYYTTYYYDNVAITSDGTFSVDLDDCTRCGESFSLSTWLYYYYGYTSLSSAYEDCVTSYADYYAYESSVPE